MLDGFFDKLANTLVRDNSFLADSVIGASVFYGCEKSLLRFIPPMAFFFNRMHGKCKTYSM